MENKFKYLNDEDKCFGITGMVISLNVFDNQSMLRQISIDAPDGECLSFTPDFFFCNSPRYSAKLAWNEIIKQYQLLTGMLIGNVMCRYYVNMRKGLDTDTRKALRRLINDEGHDPCQLEDDEIDVIFNKTYAYLDNVYRDMRLASIARRFANTLLQRRTMSGSDIADEFRN